MMRPLHRLLYELTRLSVFGARAKVDGQERTVQKVVSEWSLKWMVAGKWKVLTRTVNYIKVDNHELFGECGRPCV